MKNDKQEARYMLYAYAAARIGFGIMWAVLTLVFFSWKLLLVLFALAVYIQITVECSREKKNYEEKWGKF